jgi:hypothetical protein
LVVYDCHIDPNYFLDEMTAEQVLAVTERNYKEYQNGWEQTRWLAYINAASQGAKVKKPQDLIKFSWEETSTVSKESVADAMGKSRVESMWKNLGKKPTKKINTINDFIKK